MISQTELARRLKVSQTAVSVALRHREKESRLDPNLAERIRAGARRFGYQPNLLARSLAGRRTQTLGVVISDFGHPTFGQLLNHLQAQALAASYQLVVTGSGERDDATKRVFENLLQRRVDAIIWIDQPSHMKLTALKQLWKQASVPIIGIGTAYLRAGVPSVLFDSMDAVEQLATLAPDESSVLFLQGDPRDEFSRWRWECVKKVFNKRARLVSCAGTRGMESILSFITERETPLLLGDQGSVSLRALQFCLAKGWLPRKDFFVASFDAFSFLRDLKPAMTSMQHPLEQMATRAIELALASKPSAKPVLIAGRLLRGDTL